MEHEEEALLTVQDLADRLTEALGYEVKYGALRNWLRVDKVREVLDGRDVEGVQGLRYPATAVEAMTRILDAAKAKLITPSTVTQWLNNTVTEPGDVGEGGALVVHRPGVAGLTQRSNERLLVALEKIADTIPDDRLLTEEEAAQLLGLKSARPIRHLAVKIGRYRRWRKSDVQRFIAGL